VRIWAVFEMTVAVSASPTMFETPLTAWSTIPHPAVSRIENKSVKIRNALILI
jgi:hypothetical protein